MRKLLLLITLIALPICYAQEKIEYIDYEDMLPNISSSIEKKEFDEVVKQLDRIHPNDSIYETALVLKSYYLLEQKKFDEVLAVVEEGLNTKGFRSRYSFFVNKGVAYLRSKRYKEAIEVYTQAITEFPKNYVLLYNRAVAYEGVEKYKEAIDDYKQSIILNPFYAKSHLQLGKICYREHKISQALMAINMYLLLDADGDESFSVLNSINNSVSKKNESVPQDIMIDIGDDSFDDIDLIISNGIALSAKYEVANKINIALTKQNHALLEQLVDYEGEEGFWAEKYVPFYQWIFTSGYFDDFTYTVSYAIQNEKYKKIVAKNTSKITTFIDLFYTKWTEIMDENEQLLGGKKQQVTHFFENYVLKAVGVTKENKTVGNWEMYDTEGMLSGKGMFDDQGARTGEWIWYDQGTIITDKENYKDGKLDGVYRSYYLNGILKTEAHYKEGKLHGLYKRYTKKGALTERKRYIDDQLQGGYESYHEIGTTAVDYTVGYTDGKLDGQLIRKYANGQLFDKATYTEGKITGSENIYYAHGQLKATYNYIKGVLSGPYIKYHPNGTTHEEGTTVEGYYHGDWKVYYPDGTIHKTMTYDHGQLNGVYKKYDVDGKLYEQFEYKNDEVIAYTYLDKKGAILKEGKKKKGAFYYQGYSPLGVLTTEGVYDVKGGKKGTWKYYSDGVITSTGDYTDNKLNGAYYRYYTTGQRESITQYKNDSLTGYYVSYHKNGIIEEQGWYKKDKAHGLWSTYYADGSIKEKNFYHKGDLHGIQEIYSVEGALYQTITYGYGEMLSEKYYTSDANIQEEITHTTTDSISAVRYTHYTDQLHSKTDRLFGVKHGKYIRYDSNGHKMTEGTYLNGKQHGQWTWYHENGQISSQGVYDLGQLHGDYKEYYENGQLDSKSTYQFGVLEGSYESYNEDGVLIRTITYKHGDKHGIRQFFSPDGHLQVVRYYHNDKIIGYSYQDTNKQLVPMIPVENQTAEMKAYFDNGTVSAIMNIKNGNFIDQYRTYYYTGQLSRSIDYKNGDYHGDTIYYYANGNVKKTMKYQHNELHGMYKEYDAEGHLIEEITYKNDTPTGQASYFDEEGTLIKKKIYYNGLVEKEIL